MDIRSFSKVAAHRVTFTSVQCTYSADFLEWSYSIISVLRELSKAFFFFKRYFAFQYSLMNLYIVPLQALLRANKWRAPRHLEKPALQHACKRHTCYIYTSTPKWHCFWHYNMLYATMVTNIFISTSTPLNIVLHNGYITHNYDRPMFAIQDSRKLARCKNHPQQRMDIVILHRKTTII